jgi:magnesium-transporting ATPase (P-type)
MVGVSLLLGLSVLTVVFFACWWSITRGVSSNEIRSFGFVALVWGNLTMIHATRSRDRLIVQPIRASNPVLWWITGATLAALAVAIYARPVAVFQFAPPRQGCSPSPQRPGRRAPSGMRSTSWDVRVAPRERTREGLRQSP